MKKISLILIALMLFTLSACSKGENTDSPVPVQSPEAETVSAEPVVNQPEQTPEPEQKDYFDLMAEQYSEAIAAAGFEPWYVFVTDLDSDGLPELIFSDPEFKAFELSEDGVLQELNCNEACAGYPPMLNCGSEYIAYADDSGRLRCYFESYDYDYEVYSGIVSEIELILTDKGIETTVIRSTVSANETYPESYSVFSEPCEDKYTAYSTVSDYISGLGGSRMVLNIGGAYYDDLIGLEESKLAEKLRDAYADFSIAPYDSVFYYEDLQGSWRVTSGEVEGCEFELDEESCSVFTFSGNTASYYEAVPDGEDYLFENIPVSLELHGVYGNTLWGIAIADFDCMRYITAGIMEDGRLALTAQLIYSEEDYASVIWYLSKEDGWG